VLRSGSPKPTGFAGVITALDRRDSSESAVLAWRVQHIVIGGFVLTFGGFTTVALYALLDDRSAGSNLLLENRHHAADRPEDVAKPDSNKSRLTVLRQRLNVNFGNAF
jgi:hypothetical protein